MLLLLHLRIHCQRRPVRPATASVSAIALLSPTPARNHMKLPAIPSTPSCWPKRQNKKGKYLFLF